MLFADIAGSLAMIQDSDPEDARAIFDRTIEAVTAVVHSHGGTINRVLGDGVMALFGAPASLEQHAVKATTAALQILRALDELNHRLEPIYGARIRMHIGLDSGEVVVHSVSTDIHTEYDAVGRTVHVAARILALAPAGTIRISAETARQVAGFIRMRSLGSIHVKGLVDPIEIFEPLAADVVATPFELSISRGLSPFVGRDREAGALLAAADRVAVGAGELWAIVGEPGTGKSRLVHEIVTDLRRRNWRIVEAYCTMHGATTNLAPVAALLRSFYGIRDGHSAEAIRPAIGIERSSAPQDAHTTAAILSILGLAEGDLDWHGLDPPLRRDSVRNVLPTLLAPAALTRPMAVVVQDLQWASDDTVVLLDRLVQALPNTPILILTNFRPECRNPWRGQLRAHEISIETLPFHDARALIEALLGTDPSLAGVQRLVLTRSAGNPLFIEESVRSIADSGALVTADGRTILSAPLERVKISHTIQSMLSSRIDQLPPADKRLLQCASVIGANFSTTLLEIVLGKSNWPSLLDPLVFGGFIVQSQAGSGDEYFFKHPLIEEVAYAGLLRSERRTLHRQILAAMEQLYEARTAEVAERLAEHARRGEVWDKCAVYLRQAAGIAYARSSNREAAQLLEDALQVCSLAPPGIDRNRLRIDLCFDLRNALLLVGEVSKILKTLADAEAITAEFGDIDRSAKLASYLTHAFWTSGDCRRALTHGRRALRLARGRSRPIAIPAQYHHALVLMDLGFYAEANRRLGRLLDLVDTERQERFGLNAPLFILAGSYLVRSLAEVGQFDSALAHAEEIRRVADETGQTFAEAMTRLSLGYCVLLRGEPRRAVHVLTDAHARFSKLRNVTMSTVTAGFLGFAQLLARNIPAAAEWLDRGVTQASAIGVLSQQPLRLAFLAECRSKLNDGPAALAISEQAVRLAEQQRERGSLAWTLCFRGRLFREVMGDADKACSAMLRAENLARRSSMRPLAAICAVELAYCMLDLGDGAEARRYAETACVELDQLQMPLWQQRAAEVRNRAIA
ncbi:MAG: AAA family ATPase [Proteobacteria bacterium]|nr:AAA family ATPase [Pseudomonadota bacterium]MBI3498265.1 AAA family ATPase [Pseudomonadota bacterium]